MATESSINTSRTKGLTKEKMREYLQKINEFDCSLIIYHPKVVQKSYRDEHRLFYPSPYICLAGNGWKRKQKQLEEIKCMQTCSASTSSNIAPVQLIATIGIGKPTDQAEAQLQFTEQDDDPFKTRWDVKAMNISHTDQRKYIHLTVNCFFELGVGQQIIDVGAFDSRRIKVISKPSKRKQSMNKPDTKFLGMRIASGTKVSLFSRTRSQSVNTRYLFVENNRFTADTKRWRTLTIYLVDGQPESLTNTEYDVYDGFINYGSIIKLVDSQTGLTLPKMRIVRVENNQLCPKSNEPVSQLHKCSFQMLASEQNFLCINNENIVQQPPTNEPGDIDGKPISESAQWTLVSTGTAEYRFCEAMGPVERKITPIPTATSMNMEAAESHLAYVEFIGRNFTSNISVWLNVMKLETYHMSPERIRCPLPSIQQLESEINSAGSSSSNGCSFINSAKAREFRISFVRDDGVIYGTSHSIKYPGNSDHGQFPMNPEQELQ